MSATDEQRWQLDTGYPYTLRPELHKLLMARGIDYWVAQGITFWNRDDGCECLAYGYKADGVPKLAVKVVGFTDPEQAIAATLGRGTCRIEERHGDWYCTECGEMVGTCDTASELCIDGNAIEMWRFCPNCGRRIEVDDG